MTKEFVCNTDISFRPHVMSCINEIEDVSTDEEVEDDKNNELFMIEEIS